MSKGSIECYSEPFPYIIVDNFYSKEDLELIWEELNFLCYSHKFETPGENNSATMDGGTLKNIPSIFLHRIFNKAEYSNICLMLNKLMGMMPMIMSYSKSWFFKNVNITNTSCLLSYYENGGYYKKHKDGGLITILNWFFKEPKVFEGGELSFSDYDITIELKNNRTIIFPSIISHEVSEVKMNNQHLSKKLGRFCITYFISNQETLTN